ncbi:MAG: leucine-rich repeat protein [Candidatus Limisoma sp.]
MLKFKSFFLSLMLGLCCVSASAGTFVVDGINYNVIDSVARRVEVIANNYAYNVTIPATVKCDTTTYTVTSIGYNAFSYTGNLYQVTLPETIEAICEGAFYSSNLFKLNFPASLRVIDKYAFHSCKNLTEAILPDSLEFIGEYAFNGSGLLSVTIPTKVKYIYNYTFYGCEALSTVVLPDELMAIESSAFYNCVALHELTMPSALKIGDYAFNGCLSLEHLVLPENLSDLGRYAFKGCSGLISVSFPGNYITKLNSDTFRDCTGLKDVKLPEKLVYIEACVFQNCKSLERIDLPSTLYSIGGHAFRSSGLKSVWIPRHVKTIDGCAFSETPLQSVYVPHSVIPSLSWNMSDGTGWEFYNTSNHCDLYVRPGMVNTYKNEPAWYNESSSQNWRSIQEMKFSAIVNDRKLIVGSSEKLDGTFMPDCLPADSLTWKSSNPAVATVDRFGNVTALAAGETTISVTIKAYELSATGTCTVTVNDAPDTNFAVANRTDFAGTTVNVPVEMNNNETITAFQCDVYLPDELSLVVVEDEYDITFAGRESRTHTLSSRMQADGAIRIVAFSSKNTAFTGNEGALFNLPIVLPDNVADYQVEIKNIYVVDNNNVELRLADLAFNISAVQLVSGDANADKKVSVADATTTVSYILEENPEPFNFAAADVNADDAISIADVTGIVDIVLGVPASTSSLAAPKNLLMNVAAPEGDCLYANNLTIAPGETKDFEICLANSQAYTAFQCDIYLPEELNFLEEDGEYIVDLSSRKSRTHTIASNVLSNGSMRVVSFSSKNANFSGNDGALMILPVVAGSTLPAGKLEMSIKAISFVANNIEYDLPDCTFEINASSGVAQTKVADMSIYAEGKLLHIDSPRAAVVPMTTVDGKVTLLNVVEGENTFAIGAPGFYIVGRTKVLVK